MTSPLFDSKSHRTNYHGHSTSIRRLVSSRIARRPLMFGFIMVCCTLLMVLGAHSHFNDRNHKRPDDTAQSEPVHNMTSYSWESTNVALVIPKTQSDDVRWVHDYLQTQPNTTSFIYSMDEKPEQDLLIPRSTRGRETSAYLSYVIDYYDQLPPFSIFIHAGETQRHNDLFGEKTRPVLENLRLEAVQAQGYINLRCEHSPGCPSHVAPNNPTEIDIQLDGERAHFPEIYRDLFGADKTVPDAIGGPCCAQFAVSRDQIQRRPKSDYLRMLDWVDRKSRPRVEDYGVGWVFETVWHVVFSKEDVNCPAYEQCRCDNYGWCGPLVSGETLTPIDKKPSTGSVS